MSVSLQWESTSFACPHRAHVTKWNFLAINNSVMKKDQATKATRSSNYQLVINHDTQILDGFILM